MPKIIENLEPRLLAEARHQVERDGFSAMTIRSVAAACGVGVGTVYNYFSSKEAMVAAFMLPDWQRCIAVIREAGETADGPDPVLRCIYGQLGAFSHRHEAVFRDETAAASFAGSFSRYHALLRSQLAQPLRRFCSSDFSAEFIAEALLTWTMAGKSYEEIHSQIRNLF